MPVIWLQFRGFAVSKCIRQRQRSGMGVVLNKCHFGIVYVAALNWDWIIHQRRQIVTKVGGSLCSSSITGGHWHSTRVTHHTYNKYLTIMKSHDHKAHNWYFLLDVYREMIVGLLHHMSVVESTAWFSRSRTWVGLIFIWMFQSSCQAALPILPFSPQPRQKWADSGTAKIKVNPT